MKRLRVLKLGWEFPPRIHGGLGVACFGLSKALAPRVDLRVLVPNGSRPVAGDGFDLVGVNQLNLEDVQRTEAGYRYESFAEIERIPIHLDPYASSEASVEKIRVSRERIVEFSKTEQIQLDRFKGDELYGEDLAVKVIEFSKIAAKLALQQDFDLVHAHDWMTFLAGLEVKKATGRPLVLHVHSLQYDRAGEEVRDWIYDIEAHGMKMADRVIPVSAYTGGICESHYGVNPAKIRPVHNGIDPVAHYGGAKHFPEKLVLFIGRLTAQKGPDYFLKIASRILEKEENVRFVMAGAGDQLGPLVESGAFRGLGDRFHLTGFLGQEKLRKLLAMADVYCMPSVSEPFGLSALEAAQCGVPAVISRQSGCAEVLKGALTADFWDTELMASHILDLLGSQSLRQVVVDRTTADIAQATWEVAAGKVESVYRELVP